MHRRVLLAAAAAVLASAAAHADPKADAILAAARAASGGAAWDRIEGETGAARVETGGLSGTATSTIDVKTGAYRDDFVLGPAKGAQGFDGTTVWSVDPSGQPRVESGADAHLAAINSAYRNSLAYWYPDRHHATITYTGQKQDAGAAYDVIRIVPEGGRPFDFWIDTKTHLISRMAEKGEVDLSTEYYSDFRDVQGTKVPFATRVSIGTPKYDQHITVTKADIVPRPAPATFRMPAPPAADFSFPAGQNQVVVPFKLVNNHIYLPVTVEGHPTTFVFDTGATNVLGRESEAGFGVKDQGALPGGGVGNDKQDVGLATVKTLGIGGLNVKTQLFATMAQADWLRVEGVPSAGLIGYEIAKRVPITIDYAAGRMTFWRPGTFKPPAGAVAVPFAFNEHLPQIDGSIDGAAGKFDIDTGSRATIDIPGPFAAGHNLVQKYKLTPPMVTGWGVGGPARSRLAYAGTVQLGSVALKAPLIELSTQTGGAFSSPYLAGNVGGGFLSRFTVGLDYAHQTLYLARNKTFGAPWPVDRSGIWIMATADGQGAQIAEVTPGTPGARAGLATVDRIVAVNSKPVASIGIPALRAALKGPAGTTLRLKVAGPHGERDVRLTLADIVPVPKG